MDPEQIAIPEFKDQTEGLRRAGCWQIGVGCLFGLAAMWTALAGHGRLSQSSTLARGLSVLTLGCYWIALGAGSVARRRWARALCLSFSMVLLFATAVALPFLVVVLPRMSARPRTLFISLVLFAGPFTLMEAIFFRFYRRSDVRATVEKYDRVESWTDRVPLHVMVMSTWLCFTATGYLQYALRGTFFLLGTAYTGAAAVLLNIAAANIYVALAIYLCQLRLPAWRALLATQLFVFLNIIYRSADTVSGSSNRIAAGPVLQGIWLLFSIGVIAHVFYIRRYFAESGGGGPDENATPVAPT